jgi:DNA-binding PadR family transcriptional regulator
MASLGPEELKLALLKVLSSKPLRQQHRNDIIGRPSSRGEIERSLNRVLDPVERVLAGKMLRELEEAGLARPTYRDLSDPENWIEITDAGAAALEAGVLDRLDGVLNSIDRQLLEIRRGAWSALRAGRPDSLRQAAHSGRELMEQVLKATAPDGEVKDEPGFRADPGSKSGVTRRMRLRLTMKKYLGDVSESDLDVVDAASELVLAVDNRLIALAHSRTVPSREDVKGSLEAAEMALHRLLLRVDERSDS